MIHDKKYKLNAQIVVYDLERWVGKKKLREKSLEQVEIWHTEWILNGFIFFSFLIFFFLLQFTCLICNLFDDEDKDQYHCDGCGICRIGGRNNFFHCEVCNMCLPLQLKTNGHRVSYPFFSINNMSVSFFILVVRLSLNEFPIYSQCVENISRSNCPVCLGDIHTSRYPCHIPDCGHLLHKTCFDQLVNTIYL